MRLRISPSNLKSLTKNHSKQSRNLKRKRAYDDGDGGKCHHKLLSHIPVVSLDLKDRYRCPNNVGINAVTVPGVVVMSMKKQSINYDA